MTFLRLACQSGGRLDRRRLSDQRPLIRRVATRVHNGLLRLVLDFKGTDTHGLKAFERERLLPVVNACVVDRDVFASELVIRAWRSGTRWCPPTRAGWAWSG